MKKLEMEALEWYQISDSKFEIMQNSTGELFVRIAGREIRMTPGFTGNFSLTSNSQIKTKTIFVD